MNTANTEHCEKKVHRKESVCHRGESKLRGESIARGERRVCKVKIANLFFYTKKSPYFCGVVNQITNIINLFLA